MGLPEVFYAEQLARDRLPPDFYAAWLGEDAARNAAELLRPNPSEEMRAYRVSTAVNGARNDGPECAEPAA